MNNSGFMLRKRSHSEKQSPKKDKAKTKERDRDQEFNTQPRTNSVSLLLPENRNFTNHNLGDQYG